MSETISDVWDDPNRKYPTIAYIETTNICQFNCVCCLNDRCKRVRGTMTLDDFKKIADKIKARGIKLGAVFCFGEPLLDPTFIEKCAYAKSIGVFTNGHIGFNTNVQMLTPEKYDGIMRNTSNITLSFFNTGEEYERLTRTKPGTYAEVLQKAKDFIRYRDEHFTDYQIFIGVNKIEGHNLENVKKAFEGYNVRYAQDAELRWGGKVITGVIDRMIMYPDWRCDMFGGKLQIKYDGSCELCAYDIISGETKFANILTDSWEEINRKFRLKVKDNTLCKRCDFFYNCKKVIANGFKKPDISEDEYNKWQRPYLNEGEEYVK